MASIIRVLKLISQFATYALIANACTVCASAGPARQRAAPSQQVAAAARADIGSLIQQVVSYQLEQYHHSSWALRYRLHRIDGKEDTVRDVIESADGNVARTLLRQGRPLSAEQEALEQQRLRSLTVADIRRHAHGSESSEKYGADLIRSMPAAMLYTLAPGQPQMPRLSARQIVLDYKPNPQFQPASTAQSLLSGLAGRIWVDEGTHHLLRMEINVTKNLNLALGLIARVYQGGTMVYEQRPAGGGHDTYSHIEINVTLRELMVKTVPYHSTLDTSDATLLSAPPSWQEAVTMLLKGQGAEVSHHE